MGTIWYRGESTSVAPAKPGEWLHDLGEGVYFTDSVDAARAYAELRVFEGGGQPIVWRLAVQPEQLGRVLDLTADPHWGPKWSAYLETPLYPKGPSPRLLIQQANENYGRFFNSFVSSEKIDLSTFDTVIAQDFVRPGRQMCIRHVGGRPSPLAAQLRAQMRPVARAVAAQPERIPSVRVPSALRRDDLLIQRSGWRNAARSPVGQFALAALVASGFNWLADRGIQHAAEVRLEARQEELDRYLSAGTGVLVVLHIATSTLGDAMVPSRWLNSLSLVPGISREAALNSWRSQPQLLPGAPNAVISEEYIWVAPN